MIKTINMQKSHAYQSKRFKKTHIKIQHNDQS